MDVDLGSYTHHLDPNDLRRILHHGHWIPVTRGMTQRFFDEHYPGWCWNSMIDFLEGAGIAHRRLDRDTGKHPQYLTSPLVSCVHVTAPDDYAVVWIDGSVSVR